jgi:hypothetical protein
MLAQGNKSHTEGKATKKWNLLNKVSGRLASGSEM